MQYNLEVNGVEQLLKISDIVLTALSVGGRHKIFIIDDNSTTPYTPEHRIVVLRKHTHNSGVCL